MGKFNVFRALSAMVSAVFFMAVVINFASCTDNYGGADLKEIETVINDTVELVNNDTVVIDNIWKLNVSVENRVDTIDVTTEITRPGENHLFKGKVFAYPKKTGYQIFEDQVNITPKYANDGRTGGKTLREDENDSSWVDHTVWYFPTECKNVIVVEGLMDHLKNKPYVRVADVEIVSFEEPMGTRALYKKADSPRKAIAKVTFEVISAGNDSTFTENLECVFDRDLMAEDDIDHYDWIKGTKSVDPTTVQDSIKVTVTMKSGKKNEVVMYDVRKNEFTAVTFEPAVVNDFSGYHFGNVIGISAFEAEKKVAERSTDTRTVYSKIDVYSAAIAGEKPFNTKYYLKTERAHYKDERGIEADFDYIVPEVEEEGTNLNTVTSDRSGYDKAVVTNKIAVKYAGFTTPLSETKALYKEAIVPVTLKSEDWDYSSAKKSITPTSIICSAEWVKIYSDGHEERETVKKTFARNLIAKSDFTKDAADNSQRTGEPSAKDLKVNDKKDGEWSWKEEVTTISSNVALNGASAENVWEATEANEIKVTRKGKTLDFGRDGYSYRNTAKVGTASVSGDYAVYPYSATLSYTFANADAKNAVAPGKIRVEEKTFFPKEWGKLQSVAQTTTISENTKKWDYVWSLHFYNASTKKYFVLPVILTYASPDVPVWNFNYVEECDKKSYDLYNSAYYYNGVKNAVAEDNREWMQWSIAATGSEKLAYGTIKYRTAADKAWDWESSINGRATVFTHRYELKVTDGRLTAKDTYTGKTITDSHCVNGGWK